jgi:DNA-binding MarR family transcriptional regulator/N-acetylglutamate synthase-like GNAT family acetyltransferase
MLKSTINQFRDTAIPVRIKRLGQKLNKDISLAYKKLNIEFEPKWFAICQYLDSQGFAPINEIASALDLTHPAIVQLVNEMVENNIVETVRDNVDKRKRMVSFTGKGKKIFNSILPLSNDIEEAVKELGKSAGFDILHFVDSLERTLKVKSFYNQIMEKDKKRLLDSVEILRYSQGYKNNFLQLNYEWLNKYFKVEEEDIKILSNPDDVIINKGGEIFFARIDNEIVGTCAAIKVDKNSFELAKMAVTEKAQGKQAGKKLALAVIGFAYSKGAKSVILETSSILRTAISLYESIGFKNVPGSFDSKYSRTTLRMKLDLK